MTTLLEQSDAFWDEYGIDNNFGELYENDQVQQADIHTVWTIVEGEDDVLHALPGFHVVNRVGYILTDKPWNESTEPKIYSIGPDPEDE